MACTSSPAHAKAASVRAFYISDEMYDHVIDAAAALGLSRSGVIRAAVERYLGAEAPERRVAQNHSERAEAPAEAGA